MSDADDKPEAKIFRKPIHDKATRKVGALPSLLKESERPDGARAEQVPAKGADPRSAERQPEPKTAELADPESVDDGGLFDDLFAEDDD